MNSDEWCLVASFLPNRSLIQLERTCKLLARAAQHGWKYRYQEALQKFAAKCAFGKNEARMWQHKSTKLQQNIMKDYKHLYASSMQHAARIQARHHIEYILKQRDRLVSDKELRLEWHYILEQIRIHPSFANAFFLGQTILGHALNMFHVFHADLQQKILHSLLHQFAANPLLICKKNYKRVERKRNKKRFFKQSCALLQFFTYKVNDTQVLNMLLDHVPAQTEKEDAILDRNIQQLLLKAIQSDANLELIQVTAEFCQFDFSTIPIAFNPLHACMSKCKRQYAHQALQIVLPYLNLASASDAHYATISKWITKYFGRVHDETYDMLKVLFQSGLDVNYLTCMDVQVPIPILLHIVRCYDVSAIEYLIDAAIDCGCPFDLNIVHPTSQHSLLMHVFARRDKSQERIIRFLVERGADPYYSNNNWDMLCELCKTADRSNYSFRHFQPLFDLLATEYQIPVQPSKYFTTYSANHDVKQMMRYAQKFAI